MPVDSTIDIKKHFDKQVASGLIAIGQDEKVGALEAEIGRNAQRATEFFQANIFAWANPTEDSNVARAILCHKMIRGLAKKEDLAKAFEGLVARYRTHKDDVQDELRTLLGVQTIAAAKAAMAAAALHTPKTQDGAPATRVVLPDKVEKRLNKVLDRFDTDEKARLEQLFKKRAALVATRSDPYSLSSRVSDKHDVAIADVRSCFNACMTSNLKDLMFLIEKVDDAHKNFSAAYKNAAKETNDKIKLLAMIAKAGLGQIPIVGAVAAGIAEGVITQFRHADEMPGSDHERHRVDKSHLSGFGKLLDGLSEKVKKVTSVGVSPDKIQSARTLKDLLRKVNSDVEQEATRLLDTYLKAYFREDGTAEERREFGEQRAVMSLMRSGPALDKIALMTNIQGNVDKDRNELKAGIMRLFNTVKLRQGDNLVRFVELTLWANYFRELVTPDKFDNGFMGVKDARISLQADVFKALERLGIVEHKGKRHYADVVAAGKLPYDGNPVHDLGLLMFFQWYYTINPFLVAGNNDLTDEALDGHIRNAIAEIGKAINQSKSRSTFSFRSGIAQPKTLQEMHNKMKSAVDATGMPKVA